MKCTLSIFSLLLLLTSPMAADAQSCTTAVCNAASPSESAFLAALPSNNNTNATVVVNIPAGSSTWSGSAISYTVPSAVTSLTIQGATTITFTGTAGQSSYASTIADKTTITDGWNSGNNTSLLTFFINSKNQFLRITGITYSSGSTGDSKFGEFLIRGASQKFRFDHNHMLAPTDLGSQVRVEDAVIGVMDHNVLDMTGGNQTVMNGFQAFDPDDDSIGQGDGAWADGSLWGTVNFLFMESNIFNGGAPEDCTSGGRFVMRYNTLNTNYVAVQTHATKSDGGPDRGCRAFEAYHNYITGPTGGGTGDSPIGTKGGTALIWGNSMPQGYYRFFTPSTDRNIGPPPNVNENAGQPTDWGYCGTAVNGTGSTWDGNQTASLGWPCLDGVGRGQSDALNGANTIAARLNSVTGSRAWPHQKLEPVYLFANTISPASAVEVDIRDNSTTNNRDVYYECNASWGNTCSTFTGAKGTGSGLLSARPSTCTAGPGGTYGTSPTGSYGVAYFATDANGGNGELYVCTSANTWTGIYQPYTYPHPLVTGNSAPPPPATSPGPPTNLTGVVH